MRDEKDMASKKDEKKMTLEYAYGYRDALEDVWEEVLKMATKGYSSREMQIVVKSKAYSSKKKTDEEIAELESEKKGTDIIDADTGQQPLTGIEAPEAHVVVEMNPGLSYLVKEQRPARCFEIFQRELGKERPGMCIARTSPSLIRDKYDIGKTQVIWLTRSKKEDIHLPPSSLGLGVDLPDEEDEDEYIGPSELPKLFSMVANFLSGHQGGIVLLEGVEYLISHNKFGSVLSFVQSMNEHVVTSKANLVMSINPSTLEPRELSLLERDMSHAI